MEIRGRIQNRKVKNLRVLHILHIFVLKRGFPFTLIRKKTTAMKYGRGFQLVLN